MSSSFKGRGAGGPKECEMTAQDILDFWFSELRREQWFRGGEAVDEMIRDRFTDLLEEIHRGQHDDWAETPLGRLALVLVLDQFPRNIYRGTARSFSYDEKALELVLEGLELRADETLGPDQRAFFYLPLEHSEEMEIQDRSLERYSSLVLSVPPSERDPLRFYLDYAWQHYAIIKKFGRYPHRNDILGRQASPEEIEFLKSPGSSFI